MNSANSFRSSMGKQYNKVEKRIRRKKYLRRQAEQEKLSTTIKPVSKAKKEDDSKSAAKPAAKKAATKKAATKKVATKKAATKKVATKKAATKKAAKKAAKKE